MKIIVLMLISVIHLCSHAAEIIASEPLINFSPEKDCTELQELRNTSMTSYELYVSCKLESISAVLNRIIIKHEGNKQSTDPISSVTFRFSIFADGTLKSISVSNDQNLDETLEMKLRVRLSMLKLEPQDHGVIDHSYRLVVNRI